ncbi:MAG: hypothetical protein K0Q70_1172 [Rhodospirillales bacterium]|jgi:hypothetical protein|nr:hypothetical protein [Rhodospirillales bacterium]
MSFVNIHDYALKVRRELLWDKWADVTVGGAPADAPKEVLELPTETAKVIEHLRASTIVEWQVGDEINEGLQGCRCGCW